MYVTVISYILFLRQSCSLEIGEGDISANTKSLIYSLSVKSDDSINKVRSVASLTSKFAGLLAIPLFP